MGVPRPWTRVSLAAYGVRRVSSAPGVDPGGLPLPLEPLPVARGVDWASLTSTGALACARARGRPLRALEDRVVGPPEPERVVGVERLELMMLSSLSS